MEAGSLMQLSCLVVIGACFAAALHYFIECTKFRWRLGQLWFGFVILATIIASLSHIFFIPWKGLTWSDILSLVS